MRTSVLAMLLGFSLVGCAGQISGGGGDDDDVPETCGNGAVDPGEDCDGGEGCSAVCTTEAVPRVAVTVDRQSIDTELGKSETLKATFTSEGGFAGDAAVATSFVDGAGLVVTGVVPGGPATVALTAGQTVVVDYTLGVATDSTGTALTGTWKLDVTSSAATVNLVSAVSITPTFTATYMPDTGATPAKHPVGSGAEPSTVTVKRGAIIRYFNGDTIQHDTHGDGAFTHQGGGGGQPNTAYEMTTLDKAPGSTGRLGCHENGHGGDGGYTTFTIQ